MNFNVFLYTLLKIKKSSVFHPFLFALFPFIFLFSHNLGHVYFYQIIFPASITIILSIFIFLLLIIIIDDARKAGIILSVCLILFFSYGHVYDLIKIWQTNIGFEASHIHRYLLFAWASIVIFVVFLSLKSGIRFFRLTRALNFGSLFLFIHPIILIGLYEYQNNSSAPKINTNRIIDVNEIDIQNVSTFPDIYYIIPDGHASAKTLIENFNYNNSDFTDFLINKGFYIANNSNANYMMTPTSLSSSLNMNYLPKDHDPNRLNIKNNKVVKFLKSLGYKYVHFSSGWSHTDHNIFADINIKCGAMDEFLMISIPTTILRPFVEKMNFLRSARRDKLLCTFEKISEMNKIIGPKFVFLHLETPHPPFVFGRNGEMVSNSEMTMIGWHPKEAYLNQLIFTQKKLKDSINTLLEISEKPPIILIQSDHGPAATFAHQEDPLGYPPTERNIRERMQIINAYYLPGGNCDDLLYDSISPVNSFRLIFNCYFNSNFEYLDDLSFYNWKESDGFMNVTGLLKSNNY